MDAVNVDRMASLTPEDKILSNAICKNGIQDALTSNEAIPTHSFSKVLGPGTVATDQKRTGRCWAFAGLNLLRRALMEANNMSDKGFELSQAHFMFFDKLERCNFFLSCVMDTKDLAEDDPVVRHLMMTPLVDGGQWHMFVNIVTKYGIVPKDAYPGSCPSNNTRDVNRVLSSMLRSWALSIRDGTMQPTESNMQDCMQKVHRLLSIVFGRPPESFEWTYSTPGPQSRRSSSSENKPTVHTETLSPLGLLERCAGGKGLDLRSFVTLVHCPSKTKQMYTPYTVSMLNNMTDGTASKYINVPEKDIQRAVRRAVSRGVPVWFGCEYGEMLDRDRGLMHGSLLDPSVLTGCASMTKEQAIDSQHSALNHAMLITGYHMNDPKSKVVSRWQVENSHGSDMGEKGFLCMSPCWMDRYTYIVAVPVGCLTKKCARVASEAPKTLPPWDTIGNLATVHAS